MYRKCRPFDTLCMSMLAPQDLDAARAIAALTVTNPFADARVELERQALGSAYVGPPIAWSFDPGATEQRPNVAALDDLAQAFVTRLQAQVRDGAIPTDEEKKLHRDLVLYLAFSKFEDPFFLALTEQKPIDFYDDFASMLRSHLGTFGGSIESDEIAHLFALFFQLRRAFHFTYRRILGASRPAARLRAAVWESIFTHDLDRYQTLLFDRMQDVPTLITGPSGTGKELVASAIGWSRFIPYNHRKGRFEADYSASFNPLNLTALSPTLIESELFGHCRGAFTGAVLEREGFLDRPESYATVFLDEIGDVDPSIQVKLLRVLQTRTFPRLGDGEERKFGGKIIAATHRDLGALIDDGRFREDFFYRLCADRIETPSLFAQIEQDSEELARIVLAVAHRVGGADIASSLAEQTLDVIGRDLPAHYAWPGSMRELEQCVRSVLVRRQYHPPTVSNAAPKTGMFDEVSSGTLTADELLNRYCTLVYVQSGSYEEAARRLLLDRRTVKRRVDPHWVEQLATPEEEP